MIHRIKQFFKSKTNLWSIWDTISINFFIYVNMAVDVAQANLGMFAGALPFAGYIALSFFIRVWIRYKTIKPISEK